jgi:hypothetical protein
MLIYKKFGLRTWKEKKAPDTAALNGNTQTLVDLRQFLLCLGFDLEVEMIAV